MSTEHREARVGGDASLLSMLARAVDGAADLEGLVRPLLELVRDLSGFETVYLTRIDWDDGVQVVDAVSSVGGFGPAEGDSAPWDLALCRLSREAGWAFTPDVSVWHGRTPVLDHLDVVGYLARPIEVEGLDEPWGTICAATPRHSEIAPAVVELVDVCTGLVAAALGQRRRREAERERADRAERRLAARLRFAAQVEHGLRTPLSVILGWAETLQHQELDEAARDKAIQRILDAGRRMAEQVTDLQSESRVLAERQPVERFDVAELARGLEPVAGVGSFTVEGELMMRSERTSVMLLLEHLVENAVVHTPEGTAVRVGLSRDDDVAVLVVEDDGPGLPDRDDLFEPFVSADPHFRGSGLGLHIVGELAAHLNADVLVGSSASGGARFQVTVPDSAVD